MVEANTVTIEVYGKEFTIKTSEDPEATRKYARYIDTRMKEIGKRTGAFDVNRIATLALLSITHELFATRNQMDKDNEEFSRRMKNLLDKIEELMVASGVQTEIGE